MSPLPTTAARRPMTHAAPRRTLAAGLLWLGLGAGLALVAGCGSTPPAEPKPVAPGTGRSVTPEQAAPIKRGMMADEVRRLLGEPETRVQYPEPNGEVWTYTVRYPGDWKLLEVQFTRIGMVVSATQRFIATP